jgi:hypothetical protein
MSFVFERLQKGVHMQRAEPTAKRLMLVARHFLVAEKNDLTLKQRRMDLSEYRVIKIPEVNVADVSAERA